MDLPAEVVFQHVFPNLSFMEVIELRLVCKEWKDLADFQIGKAGLLFEHVYDFDENGIIFFLGCRWKAGGHRAEWSLLRAATVMRAACSSHPDKWFGADDLVRGSQWNSPPIHIVDRTSSPRRSFTSGKGSYVKIDLGDRVAVVPSAYTLRHSSSQGRAPRNWNLEGSNDDKTWELLREHVQDRALQEEQHSTATWKLEARPQPYRFFRVVATGPSSRNCSYFHVSGLELYGRLYVRM